MNKSEFQHTVRSFYQEHGRNLPWRKTDDPYEIFVSEIMLQQTQASRVIPKYKKWLKRFPDFTALANASKQHVLKLWQGLGYNRRANYLHQSAQQIVNNYGGSLPPQKEQLLELPGVGDYTAGALQAFCLQKQVVFVETNIRTVYIYHFFADKDSLTDKQIKAKVNKTLPDQNIREWYWGLMDYGTHLKNEVGNPNSLSDSYQKQSAFEGSNRQLRSHLLSFVLDNGPTTLTTLENEFNAKTDRQKSVEHNLNNLAGEGLLEKGGSSVYQPPT
jgi:A/G-specific adenine glycosylase